MSRHRPALAIQKESGAMSNAPLDTLRLQQCVQRWRSGDRQAADNLFRGVGRRLEQIARKMLRGFPAVRDWADNGDVVQGSVLRLLHSLHRVQPDSTRHFFNLAAVHVRRELLDLARRLSGRGLIPLAPGDPTMGGAGPATLRAAEAPAEDDDLELWCRFHEAVGLLPPDEREVVGLVFYQGWTQPRIAELLAVHERTVRRRWQSACLRLNQLVGGDLPPP
jgi:RNA polymerase sigma-70 factor (ECF subfamily)